MAIDARAKTIQDRTRLRKGNCTMAAEMGSLDTFTSAAKSLSGNPLGIIALFIVLVYGFASLVTLFSNSLSPAERSTLTYFLVLFPFAVLAVFGGLVSGNPTSLYAPRDFQSEENYVRTVALIAAATANPKGVAATQVDVGAIISTVDKSKKLQDRRGPIRKRLLWVDDHPENNVLERQAFESAGFEVLIVLSTQQALDATAASQFSVIISDMRRVEDDQAGYVLLKQLRAAGLKTPFFIYSSSNLAEQRKEASDRGAQGFTNDAHELYRLVTTAAN